MAENAYNGHYAETKKMNEKKRIQKHVSDIGLSASVADRAIYVYREAVSNGKPGSRTRPYAIPASILIASRLEGEPIAVAEISRRTEAHRDDILTARRKIMRKLGESLPPAKPSEYIPRFSKELGLSEEASKTAQKLAECLDGSPAIQGKSPVGVASGVIYVASDCTMDDISSLSGTTQVTLSKAVDLVREEADDDVLPS